MRLTRLFYSDRHPALFPQAGLFGIKVNEHVPLKHQDLGLRPPLDNAAAFSPAVAVCIVFWPGR